MTGRPARITQAEVARAIRAAKQECGEDWAVRVFPDGTIELTRKSVEKPVRPTPPKLSAVL